MADEHTPYYRALIIINSLVNHTRIAHQGQIPPATVYLSNEHNTCGGFAPRFCSPRSTLGDSLGILDKARQTQTRSLKTREQYAESTHCFYHNISTHRNSKNDINSGLLVNPPFNSTNTKTYSIWNNVFIYIGYLNLRKHCCIVHN